MSNVCPENIEFQFIFEGKCPITTCQHCTKATQSGCLFLDRKETADRTITNKEISYYKKALFPEFDTYDQKTLDATVRQAQMRARAAICMQSYINWLADHKPQRVREFVPTYAVVNDVQSYLTQTFDAYEPWMIFHMDDSQKFDDVVQAQIKTDIPISQALGRMTPKKFEVFCMALSALRKH